MITIINPERATDAYHSVVQAFEVGFFTGRPLSLSRVCASHSKSFWEARKSF